MAKKSIKKLDEQNRKLKTQLNNLRAKEKARKELIKEGYRKVE